METKPAKTNIHIHEVLCVCAFVSVCTFVCVCSFVYVRISLYARTRVCVCVRVYMCIFMYMSLHDSYAQSMFSVCKQNESAEGMVLKPRLKWETYDIHTIIFDEHTQK